MKKKLAFVISCVLLAQSLWASATCKSGNGKVTLNENYTMTVSGLESKGIRSGSYACIVVAMGPGYLSTQRQIRCEKQDSSGTILMGWMIEGLDMFGRQAASVALYNNNSKVFETGCKKD